MYLKRLDVHGFKSFANKTQLQFTPGVTCIIGPNGCGKTNVADSIRWVLGEHASRTLRARKTEDVIFAGSDKRAALGMAEVSIALDNSKHWLPIDFDEVVVSRRAYRSGDNEYLINGAKVRLKDVVELFMRAQVGQNSYAFMGQGMVEQVLSLRPEDRRALIEEAADVRLYRQKLDDAQKKLKETRENVERVRMLVREIEPRINQLERQAGRAVKYRELAQELAAALHVYYEHQWRDVNDQLLAAITTQDQRGEQFAQVQTDVRTLEDGLAQLRTAIDERKRELFQREQQLRGLEDYVRDLERRVALDAERANMLEARANELTDEIAALEADLASQEKEAPLADTTELEARLEAARTQLVAQRERLDAIEHELAEVHRSALAHEQDALRARSTAEAAARRLVESADNVASLRAERDAVLEDHHKLVNEQSSTQIELAALRREASATGAEIDRAIDDRKRESASIAIYREQQRDAERDVRELRSAIEKATARLEIIEELEMRPQAPDAGIRAVLEAAGLEPRELTTPDTELRGVVGRVGQIMRVPSGLERAVEAALAENLHAIVFEHEEDLNAAVKMLVENDFGRATMYALDNFHEQRPLHLIKERGIIGVASDMVRCEGKYRKLVDTLLGRTVVVDNIDIARRFVRRGLAGAVATLDGVLVRPIGSVAAGAASTIHTAFAYQREAGDLPEELSRLRPQVEQKEALIAQATQRLLEAERRLEEQASAIETAREKKAAHDRAVASAEARLAELAARIDSMQANVDRTHAQIARIEDTRESDQVQVTTNEESAHAALAREQRDRVRLAALDQERAPLLAEVAELAAVVAHLDGELRAERSATQGERLALERLQRQISQKQQQVGTAREELQSVTVRLTATRREHEEKAAELATLSSDFDPAREELAQLESRERSMTAQLAESNERLRSVERAHIDAEAEVRLRTEELESLRVSLQTEGFVATADGEVQRLPDPEPERVQEEDAVEAYAPSSGEPPSWMRSDDESDLPPVRGGSAVDVAELRDRIAEMRGQIRGLGPINEEAASEYGESRERFDYLSAQLVDLGEAEGQLLEAIGDLDKEIRAKFSETFKLVNTEFARYFSAFFRGGTARLELGEVDEDGLPGIEIYAQPPGKKLGSLALLSGGERSLTAVALLFALLQANPSPICVLDEVDAALDEANVGRFVEELRALAEKTQFIIITHNRRTIENADTIYGVSMAADSVSRVLGLRLDQVHVDDE